MKRFLVGLMILIFLIFAGNADAFKVKLINDTDEIVYFKFIWGECDWKNHPKIFPVWTGQISPGDIKNSDLDYYRAGKWAIEFTGSDSKMYAMKIPSDKGILILKVTEPPLFLLGL